MRHNEHGQPIGEPLEDWMPPPSPERATLSGRTVAVEPMSYAEHGAALFASLSDAPESLWTYMGFGPLRQTKDLEEAIGAMTEAPDWRPYAIVTPDDGPCGIACYLRIQPPIGVIEIGSIVFSPRLQRTTAATEALYLMMRHAFDLGYRRCEWKCDALNEPSRRAAVRLGFAYEGIFRQATHYKGRNRDTAWYAIIDGDWPELDAAFTAWLAPDNFDATGSQCRALGAFRG